MRGRLTAVLLLLAGCGFYNGYNGIYAANKFASQARRSERDGRPSEAAGFWGQASVKAESLLARQPRGKWRDEALAIRGEALASLNRCSDAVTYLHQAYESTDSRDVREQSALALGRCELALGQPAAAAVTLAPLLGSHDVSRRNDARKLRGRALLLSGDYETALAELRATGASPTSTDVIGALAGLGQESDVQSAFDELAARHDSTLLWDSVLASVGQRNPIIASQMLDRLIASGAIAPARVPELLGRDAARLEGEPRERRLEQLVRLAPESEAGDAARFEFTRRRLHEAASLAELSVVADSLRSIAAVGQPSAQPALALAEQAAAIVRTADSVSAGAPQGDLRIFLAGEITRDSLLAPAVALGLFRRVVTDWPEGAYAPKALLAGRQLDPSWAAVTDSLLEGRYADNPYVVAARGGDRTAMRQLEDSMAAFENTLGLAGRAGAGRAGQDAARGSRNKPGQGKVQELQ